MRKIATGPFDFEKEVKHARERAAAFRAIKNGGYDLQLFSSAQWSQDLAANLQGPFTAVTAAAITALFPDIILPANQIYVGWKCYVDIFGKISTAASTPGTATFQAMWGGSTGMSLGTSGALALVAGASNIPFHLEYMLTCQSIAYASSNTGATLGIFTQGWFTTTTAVYATPGHTPIPASAPAVVTSLSASASEALDFNVTFSAATNSITVNEVVALSTALGL